MTQNIDMAELEALNSALDSLLEKFAGHDQLRPLLVESKTEADKQQPQFGLLRGWLAGIKAIIGVLKDGTELFEDAERAAVACGMDALPPMLS